ncbi:MAG: MBL fold metallo-hydrolase [Spirochaetaceae bacterium]
MKKIEITNGIYYLEVPEVGLRILCGCPENSIKFIMQKKLTPSVKVNDFNLVGGPNAILLNDISIMNSHFLNFSEFPVLHQQYFQGAAFNGSNEKFILIGNKNIVNNQYAYIRRGLHGLLTKEEVEDVLPSEEEANRFIAIANFHRGKEKKYDIINKVNILGKTHIKEDLYLERKGLNIFEFTYKDESIIIDINLDPTAKGVGLPYNLDYKFVKHEDFSITTIGDGNGWNSEVPCMGSLINVRGKRYLVDSGPGSLDLINHLGIAPSEIEGVFVTHSHDDHFAGILSLLNVENKIKFFSSGIVIASVQKKFLALIDIELDELKKYIDFIELKESIWTNIGEMEVKPKYSFHTIETNVFYFRTKNTDGEWKTYGHITDIISKNDLEYMLDNDKSGIITRDWAYDWFNGYLEKCDLKRIDAGGGVVHGNSNDFKDDLSTKIILSHLNHDIDTSVSSNFYPPTDFGHTEVLISSSKNYPLIHAEEILTDLGCLKAREEFACTEIVIYTPGDIISHKGQKISEIFLVLSGLVEATNLDGYKRKYIKGDFLYTFNNEKKSNVDFIATNYCQIIKIKPKSFYNHIKDMKLTKDFFFLRSSRFFSYGFSFKKLLDFSKKINNVKVKKGETINLGEYDYYFIENGSVEILENDKQIRILKKDEINVYHKTNPKSTTIAIDNCVIGLFKQKDAYKFTSLLWSVFEEMKKIDTIVETGII